MIYVLAGVNGAGKSSIGGSAIRAAGQDWYNPDQFARDIQSQYPNRSTEDINSHVWHEGRRRLLNAIESNTNFAFETTLGGSTITNTLLDGIAAGVDIRIWYCGLTSPELHIERVAARVARGGHNIPEGLVRSRYLTSMRNICRLAPGLAELAVYDNSNPIGANGRPAIRHLIQMADNKLLHLEKGMPQWAKPVAAVVLKHATKT